VRCGCFRSDHVIVELKAVHALEDLQPAQLLTYLRLSGRRIGLLINFNVPLLKQGIRRVVFGPQRPSSP
jgi:GxxExxY protein